MEKTPAEIVNQLSDMLIKMHEQGLIREDTLDEVDEVMATIYYKANKACSEDDGDGIPEDDDYGLTKPAYRIFEYAENKEQFAEDYKNAVQKSLHSDRYIFNFDEAAEEIISLRGS